MKTKILLTFYFLGSLFVSGQNNTVLFYDGFEQYQDWIYSGIGNWTLTDVDGEEQAAILGVSFPNNQFHPFAGKIINSTAATPGVVEINIPGTRNYEARTGQKVLGMFASLLPANNDWIISPPIQLGNNGNKLSFYVKSAHMDNEKHEKFDVLISTTDTDPQSFTAFPKVYTGDYFTESDWTEVVIDLDAYSNMEVYLAIHYISEIYDNPFFPDHLQKRALSLLLDDFTVSTASTLGTQEYTKNKKINIYPNPFKNDLHLQADEKIQNIKIFDMTGRLLFEKSINTEKKDINLSFLKPGTYIAEIQKATSTERVKIIKE